MSRKRKRKNPAKFIIIIAAVCVLLGVGGVYGYQVYKGYMKDYAGTESYVGEDVEIVIPEGSSVKTIAKILKENGLITYESAFVNRVKESEYRGTLRYGTYTLNTGMNTLEMIAIMGQSTQEPTVMATVTIPEGYSIEMIAARLEEQGIFTAQEFLDAVQNGTYEYDFLASIPEDSNLNYRLQGFLFPATYNIYEDTTPEDLVNRMLKKFDEMYTDAYRQQADLMGYSAFQVVNMAAIVEREAKLESERPIIAGVINNRLEINMKLQMCPTVLYPLTQGMYNVSQVTYADLELDSPYNTYMYEGLPVGPICNPGITSIAAVLYPTDSSYLYYHTDDESIGSHIFTETYEEHIETQN